MIQENKLTAWIQPQDMPWCNLLQEPAIQYSSLTTYLIRTHLTFYLRQHMYFDGPNLARSTPKRSRANPRALRGNESSTPHRPPSSSPDRFRLHSHDVKWGSGSGQQSVTSVNAMDDPNSYWVIKAAHGASCPQGTPVQHGQVV